MVTAKAIREALQCGRVCKCQSRTGPVHCPAHDDEHPSLSVSSAYGTNLFKCFAGCTQDAVINALRGRKLWPIRGEAVDAAKRSLGPEQPTVKRWQAFDAKTGRLIAAHVREDRPGERKRMWWEPSGVRVANLGLYRVEQLKVVPDRPVVINEGESCTDALALLEDQLGVVALGTMTGAGPTPCDDALRPLVGRTIYLWADADAPGRGHMNRITKRLRVLGAQDVRLIEWQGAPENGDAADAIEAGVDIGALLNTAATGSADADESETWTARDLINESEALRARGHPTWVRAFIDYADMRTDAPRAFKEGVAWAALSVATGRRVKLRLTIGDVVVTIWIMLVADSTVHRKSTILNIGTDILDKADLPVVAPDDFSPQRFATFMGERDGTQVLFRRDEFAGFYDGLNRLEHQVGLKQLLIAFYDGRKYERQLQGDKVKDDDGAVRRRPEVIKAEAPFLSIAAGIQRELFLDVARHEDISGGFLPRFSFIVPDGATDYADVGIVTANIDQVGSELAANLSEIAALPERSLAAEPEALRRWNRYCKDLQEEAGKTPIPSIAAPVFERHGHIALKLAAILAFCEGITLSLAHVLVGIETAERWRKSSVALLSALGPSRDEKRVQRVLDLVRRKPGIGRGKVMQALRLMAKDIDQIEATLRDRGLITINPTAKGKAYAPVLGTYESYEVLPTPSRNGRAPSADTTPPGKALDKTSKVAKPATVDNDDWGEV